jgi:hypothetical protein
MTYVSDLADCTTTKNAPSYDLVMLDLSPVVDSSTAA